MKLICRKDLLNANINIAIKAVSGRTTLPILECLLLSAEPHGLYLTGNDLEIAIKTHAIPAEIITPGTIALEAKVFADIVRKLPDADVYIESDDKYVTTIKCGKVEFKILGQSGDDYPLITPVSSVTGFKLPESLLKSMIRRTLFCVSSDESKPVLTGELIELTEGFLNVVAVDGFRIAYAKEPISCPVPSPVKTIIPAKTLSEIMKLADDDGDTECIAYFTDKHVMFEFDSCTVLSRVIDGEFIRFDQIYNDTFTTTVTANRQDLLHSIERVSLITAKDSKKNPIKVSYTTDGAVITSKTEMGNAKDELAVTLTGNPLDIAFNPRYLLDAIRAVEEDVVELYMQTPLSPCIIKGLDNQASKYLVLPLRIGNM